ncbi:ATP-binding protein [Halorientalis halophila]|uniref:ATP-binding protein n=1 Tax=Halorientalis halophila TaxID=3108499 RepID=UPI003008FC6A
MSRALLAAKSGWGKSWLAQQWTEDNAPDHDLTVLLDYKDEYRGLVKAGLATWAAVTDREMSMTVEGWREFLESNERVVLARSVTDEQWQEVAAKVARAVRGSQYTALVVIDESHFVAPQRTGYPDAIRGLATTGRGEGVSSMWITQRLSEMDETPVAQSDVRLIGGLTSDADLAKVGSAVDYNEQVHNPMQQSVRVPDAIDRDGQPLQKYEQGGQTVGSEWIHSDDSGAMRRIDSRDLSMRSTHFSPDGNTLTVPGT